MRNQRRGTKAGIVIAAVGSATLMSGTAYAYWSTAGTGNGSAQAATIAPNALALAVEGVAPTGLFPTGSVTGVMRVTNPHPFNVTITGSTVVAPSFATATTDRSGCTGGTVTFTPGSPSATTINKNNGSITIPFTAAMSNTAENECQGATFTSVLTVNAQSTSG